MPGKGTASAINSRLERADEDGRRGELISFLELAGDVAGALRLSRRRRPDEQQGEGTAREGKGQGREEDDGAHGRDRDMSTIAVAR
jgi:hypothetical protein